MHNLVIGPLQECRIDRDHWPQALRGEARGKGHRMLLGNPHIIEAVRKHLFKGRQTSPVTHGGRNGYNSRILPREPNQRVDGNRTIRGSSGLLGRQSGLPIKGRAGMKPHGIFHGRLVPEAFFGNDMQESRPL